MKEAGLANTIGSPKFFALKAPFSNFDFVDTHFDEESAIRRLFSQARSQDAKTLIVEDIKAESHFFFVAGKEKNGEPKFLHIPSQIESHTDLYIKRETVRLRGRRFLHGSTR